MKRFIFTAAALTASAFINVNAQENFSATEKEDLIFMWQEEKLARDVYDSMYRKYYINPFVNIRQSERRHMAEMERLITKFNITYHVTSEDLPGYFDNVELKKLYFVCISNGSQSEKEALRAGALIEETDIKDLKERVKHTQHTAIQEAYQYLLMGSENHLRAFCRRLKAMDAEYKPMVLDTESFQKILDN